MYNLGAVPTVFLHPGFFIDPYLTCLFKGQNINWCSFTKRLAERLIGYVPDALIILPENPKVIVNVNSKLNVLSGNIPTVCISERDDNPFLKHFLALGGEALFIQDNEIIWAIGSNSQSLGTVNNYKICKDMGSFLLGLAIAYILELPMDDMMLDQNYTLICQ